MSNDLDAGVRRLADGAGEMTMVAVPAAAQTLGLCLVAGLGWRARRGS